MIAGRPPLSAAGRALRHRNFRLFFGGELVSITGSWIQYTAQAWLVVTLVGNASAAFYLGLLGALQVLPVLVLGLFGGIIADVLPKRRPPCARARTLSDDPRQHRAQCRPVLANAIHV